jgi:exodeoxyribonuclease VII large subunit
MQATQQPDSLSVTRLTDLIKGTLETNFHSIWVEGEISDIAKPRSGHVYLTLKDQQSQIRGVIWRSVAERIRFDLCDGQSVLCFGSVDVYAARGSYQLMIKKIQPQGVGALQLALEQLQRRLLAEGLFNPELKRQLPRFPKRIGLVTSPTSAAVRDFLEVAHRRWPGIQIVVIPAVVQGAAAPKSIIQGIIAANAITPSLDVLVVGRGGGSLEDLWCFNDEFVVRAIAASTVPTVSAVGHEIDVTLADLVADVRALTPSAAAEIVVPSMDQWSASLEQLGARLRRPILGYVEMMRSRLESLAARPALRRPFDRIHEYSRRLDELDARARRAIGQEMKTAQSRLQRASATLSALSPLATLSRGYTVTSRGSDGQLVGDVDDVEIGDEIVTRLANGRLHSRVTNVAGSANL